MFSPLKYLKDLFTPKSINDVLDDIVEDIKPERIEPTIGESIPLSKMTFDMDKVMPPGQSFKPLTGDELVQIAAIEITEEKKKQASAIIKRNAEARRNNRNAGQRRSRKNRDSGSRPSHTSYGHDDGPSCNSPSPSPSSNPVCGGGE